MLNKIKDLFGKNDTLLEPSDAEIMAAIGGTVRVISARPEDFPGFRPLCSDPMDLPLRARAMTSFVKRTCPDIARNFAPTIFDPNSPENLFNADRRSAFVRSFCLNDRPSLFFLIRPSHRISGQESISNASQIDSKNLAPYIPDQDFRFICVRHEMGHMLKITQDIDFGSGGYHAKYYEELFSDHWALVAYRKQGGSEENIKKYIDARALEGFLDQPPEYWLAPNLKASVINKQGLNFNDTYMPVWKAYMELRARVLLRLAGNYDTDQISSHEIVDTCLAIDQNKPHWGSNQLRWELGRLNNHIRNPGHKQAINSGVIFKELDRVVRTIYLPPFTRECGEQILDAARSLCPRLTPPNGLTREYGNDNRL